MSSTRLIRSESDIASVWHLKIDRGYPVPTQDRDEHLEFLFPKLEAKGIYSRGRFGAWKYEVGNQDHTFMRGVEAVSHLLSGVPEMTVRYPSVVNESSRSGQVARRQPCRQYNRNRKESVIWGCSVFTN